jgi:hypothetical protein
MHRKLTIAFAAIAVSVGVAGQAQAATGTVRLHTAADTTRFLSDSSSGIATMAKSKASDPAQKWRKVDTELGFATYSSLKTIQDGKPRCLTGRGATGFPVITSEKCVPGARNQQWRLEVTGQFKLRLNGLPAKHNTGGNGTGVLMAPLFTNQANQKWHTHPAA